MKTVFLAVLLVIFYCAFVFNSCVFVNFVSKDW